MNKICTVRALSGLDWIGFWFTKPDWTGSGSLANGLGPDRILSNESVSYSMKHIYSIWSLVGAAGLAGVIFADSEGSWYLRHDAMLSEGGILHSKGGTASPEGGNVFFQRAASCLRRAACCSQRAAGYLLRRHAAFWAWHYAFGVQHSTLWWRHHAFGGRHFTS